MDQEDIVSPFKRLCMDNVINVDHVTAARAKKEKEVDVKTTFVQVSRKLQFKDGSPDGQKCVLLDSVKPPGSQGNTLGSSGNEDGLGVQPSVGPQRS